MSETDKKEKDTPPPQKPAPMAPVSEPPSEEKPKVRLEPTRYGDWELNGKCVDF